MLFRGRTSGADQARPVCFTIISDEDVGRNNLAVLPLFLFNRLNVFTSHTV